MSRIMLGKSKLDDELSQASKAEKREMLAQYYRQKHTMEKSGKGADNNALRKSVQVIPKSTPLERD